MPLTAECSYPISGSARKAAQLGLEAAEAEAGMMKWDQRQWVDTPVGTAIEPPHGFSGYTEDQWMELCGGLVAVMLNGCDSAGCIAAHVVAAGMRCQLVDIERHVEDHVGDVAGRILELPETPDAGIGPNLDGPLHWVFEADTSKEEVRAMFNHAIEHGEWPHLSCDDVRKQLLAIT